jgi:hypothetical protein
VVRLPGAKDVNELHVQDPARFVPKLIEAMKAAVPADRNSQLKMDNCQLRIASSSGDWPLLPDAAIHGLAGEIVRALAPHTEADPAALLVQLLCAFGNAAGRGAYFPVEGDRHYPNLFAVMVGASAKGRKGTSWSRVRQLLAAGFPDWCEGHVQSGLSSGEGLIFAVRDPVEKQEAVRSGGRITGYQTAVVDPGAVDKRLLVLEPELASTLRVMGREGNNLSAVVRQAWDTGTLRVLTRKDPIQATDAHISVVGHITRDELVRYLDSTEAGNGFANRFLWVCVRRAQLLPEGGALREEVLAPLEARLAEAVRFAAEERPMGRDEEARALWREVYPRLSEGKPGLLGAVTSRAEAQVTRLSLVYALLDACREVRRPHLEAALALWRYCEESARFIFGESLGDPLADELLRALRANPQGLTRTEIAELFGRHKRGERVSAALAGLAERGLARMVRQETGGRPSERWLA